MMLNDEQYKNFYEIRLTGSVIHEKNGFDCLIYETLGMKEFLEKMILDNSDANGSKKTLDSFLSLHHYIDDVIFCLEKMKLIYNPEMVFNWEPITEYDVPDESKGFKTKVKDVLLRVKPEVVDGVKKWQSYFNADSFGPLHDSADEAKEFMMKNIGWKK